MSSLPGIIGLMIFIYARPPEFFTELRDYNFLYVFLVISLLGIVHDVSERRTRLTSTPHLPYVLMFGLWCALTLAIRKPSEVGAKIVPIVVSMILYAVVAQGIQRVAGFYRLITVIFSLGLFVAYVGADQGFSPFECVVYNPAEKNARGWPDGRECIVQEPDGTPHDGVVDCIASGRPGLPYQCEHAGLFGTTSIGGGRVRYLGVLLDPNELALASALTVPFAFAFLEMKRTVLRLALLLATLVIVAVEIVFTQSRGGQITFGAVLGAYFIKKYGWKRGLMVGAAMAVPMVILGGRSDESAKESTLERLGCAAAGIKMLMNYPHSGVGYSQFTENHNLTAHNAYVLACGELGLPGMWLFGILMYLSIKIPVSVLQLEMVESKDSITIKALAMGLLAAMIGGAMGIFFLSWTYHYVLWIHFGMCGALYGSVKRDFPTYECRLSWKEARAIFAVYVGFLIFWTGYIKSKGAWDN